MFRTLMSTPFKEINPVKFLTLFMQQYGRFAFGIIAVVVMWKVMVEPVIQSERHTSAEVVKSLNTTAESMRSVAVELVKAVEVNARTAESLRITAEKMNVVLELERSRSWSMPGGGDGSR